MESIKFIRFGERATKSLESYGVKVGTYSLNDLKQNALGFYSEVLQGKGFVESVVLLRGIEGVFCNGNIIKEGSAIDSDLRLLHHDASIKEKVFCDTASMLLNIESPNFEKYLNIQMHNFCDEFCTMGQYTELCGLLGGE